MTWDDKYDIERILLDLVSGLVPKTINYKKAKEACGVVFNLCHIFVVFDLHYITYGKKYPKKKKKKKKEIEGFLMWIS